MSIERECLGYKYTSVEDEDRSNWSVETDYLNENVNLSTPHEASIAHVEEFGKAVVKACKDMKREMKDNRVAV